MSSLPIAKKSGQVPVSVGSGVIYEAQDLPAVSSHDHGALSSLPVSPKAGDTYAVTVGTGDGRRYYCYVDGVWQLELPSETESFSIPDGAGTTLCIVPNSSTYGSTTFTDLSPLANTITASNAYNSTLRGVLGRSCCKLSTPDIGGGTGYLTIPQSNGFYFPAYDAGNPHASDFTMQIVATVFSEGVIQRFIAQGRLEDADGLWCWGLNNAGQMNFAYRLTINQDITTTGAPLSQSRFRPSLYEVGRSAKTLYLFTDGVLLGTAVVTAAIGVPVSGSPDPNAALLIGARNPPGTIDPIIEPLVGGEVHSVKIVKGLCLHTSNYDPTA